MSPYSIPPLVTSILALFLGFLTLVSKTPRVRFTFPFVALSVFAWLFGYSIVYSTLDYQKALFWARLLYIGVIFIPVFSYHFVISFLKIKRQKIILLLAYIVTFCFLFLSRTEYFITGLYKYFWGYQTRIGPLHNLFILFFFIVMIRAAVLLFTSYRRAKKERLLLESNRIKYILISYSISILAAIDFLPNYGFQFYPLGFIFIALHAVMSTYAIVAYRALDVNIAIARGSIFILVCGLVLSIPIILGKYTNLILVKFFGDAWWIVPLIIGMVLASAGPFIYLYIDRKAEERLLKEQRRYQQTLKQASAGMTRIRNLRRLLDLITHIVTKTVRISFAAIYLYNPETNDYVLQVCRDKGRMVTPKLTSDNPLIAWLMSKREPLLYEEVKRRVEDANDTTYKLLEENMRLLTATLVIPSFLEDRLVGFFVLGEKTSGQIYTPEDIDVFQILTSQSALAIENARFYEETKQMQEQIAQAEKMATVGTMADGLSHQINNRFYALSLIAADTVDTIKMTDTSNCSPEVKKVFSQITHALERIEVNVIQGGAVVKGILKYTRKGDEGLEAITLDQILDSTLDMVQYKVNLPEIDIIRNYPKDTPKLKGNSVQLQEVLFNFIDNGYDSTVERKTILKEAGYRGRLTFSAQPQQENGMLLITVEDNGMGVKEEDKKKLFTPFFTTKVSSRQGTGLGLYVIKRVIEEFHKGKIWFESEYGKGTKFILQLPIAKEEATG